MGQPKIIYCKKCGKELSATKKCTGCGKQYIHINVPVVLNIVLSMSLAVAICCIVYLYNDYTSMTRAYEHAEFQRNLYQKNYEALKYKISSSGVAYVTPNGEKYHKLGCTYLEDSNTFEGSVYEFKSQGYEPCSKCFK